MEGLERLRENTSRYLTDRRVMGALLFALLTLVVFFRYLLADYPLGTDTLGMPTDILSFQIQDDFFSTWRWFTSLGHLNFPSPVVAGLYYFLAGVLDLDVLDITKLLFALSFFMAGYFTYLLCLDIGARPVPAAIGGVIFCFNQVFMSQILEGHFNMVFGCALVPLLFLFLIRCLNKHTYGSAAGLAIMAFIYGSVASPNMVLIVAIVIPLFCIPYLLPLSWRSLRTAFVSMTVVAIIVFQTVFFKYTGDGNSNLATTYHLSQAAFYSYNDPLDALLMKSLENSYVDSTWLGGWVFPAELQTLAFLVSLALPAAALFIIWKKRRERLVLGMGIVLVFCVLISMGPNYVLGGLFTWGFKNIPYMDSIRVYSRFGMIIGLCYGVLVPLFLSSIPLKEKYQFTMPWMKNQIVESRWLRVGAAVALAGAMVLPSTGVLTGFVGAFDLPDAYGEPFEYIYENDDQYRYLNLPYGFLYYGDYVPRFDGYPQTVTLDPGVYSTLLTEEAFAFGLETEGFWNTIGTAMNERWFGYLDSMGLVGSAANVKYVVAQVHSSDKARDVILQLDGINRTVHFMGGSEIYVNDLVMPHAYAVSSMMVTTGGYRSLFSAMGAGLLDPSDQVMVFLGQEGSDSRDQLLEESDGILVINGDLFQFMFEYNEWGNMLRHLSEDADHHSDDPLNAWIVRSTERFYGLSWTPSAYTDSNRTITIGLEAGTDRHVFIQAIKGSKAGNVTLTVSGVSKTFNLTSSTTMPTWLDLGIIPDSASQVEIVPEGNGETALIDMLTVPEAKLQEAWSVTQQVLLKHQDKLLYLYPLDQQGLSPGWFPLISDLGRGVANSLSIDVDKRTDSHGELTFPLGERNSLISGQNYGLTIQLSTQYRQVPCTLEIRSGNKVVTSTTIVVPPLQQFQTNMDFELPEGTTEVSLTVRTGSDQIMVGAVNVFPTGDLPLNIDVPYLSDSAVDLRIVRGGGWSGNDPTVTLNGDVLSLGGDGGNLTSSMNVIQGNNLLSMNISQAYALVISPSGWDVRPSSLASTFGQVSRTEYYIDAEINGTSYIVLSESYHQLWDCSGDVMSFKAFGVVNGYIVTGDGMQHHELKFNGSEVYDSVLLRYLAISLAAMVILVAYPLPLLLVRKLFPRSR